MKRQRIRSLAGFTLIEAMLVLAILLILATLAMPSFKSTIEFMRAKTAATDLYTALARARSEAIKQNANATLTSKAGGNWAQGWQILDPTTNALIEDHAAITGLTIAGPASVTYQSAGRVQGAAAPTFSIIGDYAASAQCVAVDLSGRPLIKKGTC